MGVWLEMTLAITELQTLFWYQSGKFIVLTHDKADTLYFSYIIINAIYNIIVCYQHFFPPPRYYGLSLLRT